jgi:D-lyxose ketol-isomerase
MISVKELAERRRQCGEMFSKIGIVLTPMEKEAIEIADFGLGNFAETGLGVLVYVNTDRVCAKELAMLPRQTCPEHRHPSVPGKPGKEETFRCRSGAVSVYVPGPAAASPVARTPRGREKTYTVFHEVRLLPGEQYTLKPDTLHWFQAGPEGAVVSEFSTTSTDEADVFTDPEIQRTTKVAGL